MEYNKVFHYIPLILFIFLPFINFQLPSRSFYKRKGDVLYTFNTIKFNLYRTKFQKLSINSI